MKQSRQALAALVLTGTLVLAGCSGGNENKPTNPSGSVTATSDAPKRTEFPFKVGSTIDFKEFSKEVGTANQAIKTLHVKNTNKVEVGGKTVESVAEGDVDQTKPENPSFSLKMTEGGQTTELISIDGTLYMKPAEEGWVKYPKGANINPISTSTSLFKKLSETEGAVKEVKYVEKDATGHKFTILIDMAKLIPDNPSTAKVGDVPSTVWLNDDLQLVKQIVDVTTDQGKSSLMSEQSNFNKPVKFEAPKDAKEIQMPAPAPAETPAAEPTN